MYRDYREGSLHHFLLQEIVAAMETHLRNQTRMSATTQNKLMNDEARLHAEKVKKRLVSRRLEPYVLM